MSDVVQLLLMLLIAGIALTVLGSVAIWWSDEERRIKRGLRHVLSAEPEALVVARGRGRGAGFSFAAGKLAVAWDAGAWCLVYRIDELVGAELLVNGAVLARAFRGEQRRALDQVAGEADQVTLRLVFDDPKDPDFELDLWLAGDEARRTGTTPAKAVQAANRWMARAEAIVRRPLAPTAARVAAAPEPAPPAPAPPPALAQASDDPPWDDDDREAQDDEDAEGGYDHDDLAEPEPPDDNWTDAPRRIS